MIILVILKFLIFVATIFFFGWQFSWRVLRQNQLYLLLPLAMLTGIFSYVFFLNIIAHFIPISIAFYLTYVFLLLLAGGLIYKVKPAGEIETGLPRKHLMILALVTIFLSLTFAHIITNNYQYDSDWHFGLTSTIANGVFPAKNIFAPFNFAQYHYAFNLLSASFMDTLGLDVMRSMDLAYILIFVFIFWLVFAVFYKMIGTLEFAYLSAVLFFLGGGFRYFTIFRDVDWSAINGFFGIFPELRRIFGEMAPLSPGYFHEYSISAYGVMIYHSSSFFAYPLLVLVIYLMYLEDKYGDLVYKIMLGLFLGFLALSSEVAFVFVVAAWGIWKLLNFFKDKKRIVVSILTVAMISTFVAIYQGGVISDMILHAVPSGGQGADTAVSSFRLREFPGLTSFGGFYPFNDIYSYAFLLVEWGFILLLFPLAAYQVIKRKNRILTLLLVAIGLSLSVAFSLNYPISPDNLSRFNVFAYILMSFLAAYYLSLVYQKGKYYRLLAMLIVFFTIISPFFFNFKLLFTNYKNLDEKLSIMEGGIDIADEREFAAMADELVPKTAGVVSATPFVVNTIWGRPAYFGTPPAVANFYRNVESDLKNIFNEDGIEYLEQKNLRYIYSNEKFRSLGGEEFLEDNIDSLNILINQEDYTLYEIR